MISEDFIFNQSKSKNNKTLNNLDGSHSQRLPHDKLASTSPFSNSLNKDNKQPKIKTKILTNHIITKVIKKPQQQQHQYEGSLSSSVYDDHVVSDFVNINRQKSRQQSRGSREGGSFIEVTQLPNQINIENSNYSPLRLHQLNTQDNQIQTEELLQDLGNIYNKLLDLEEINDKLVKQMECLKPDMIDLENDEELENLQFSIEKQMLKFQNQVDKLDALTDSDFQVKPVSQDQNESNVQDNFEKSAGNINFQSHQKQLISNQLFDLHSLLQLTNLPLKRSDLSQLLERYESEYKYIENMNLRKSVSDIFQTLENSVDNIVHKSKQFNVGLVHNELQQENLEGKNMEQTFSSLQFRYDILHDFQQYKDYLDNFNNKFQKFINQLMTIMYYQKLKEQAHLTQIEFLTNQNHVLFEENCQLQKQLQLKTQVSQQNLQINQLQFQYNSKNELQLQEESQNQSKTQRQMLKELNHLYNQKLQILKQYLQQDTSQFNGFSQTIQSLSLPKMHHLPLENPKFFQYLQSNLLNYNFMSIFNLYLFAEIQTLTKQKLSDSLQREQNSRLKLQDIMKNYSILKEVLVDQLVGKHLLKCKRLLEIDMEYVRVTIQEQKLVVDGCIQRVNMEYDEKLQREINKKQASYDNQEVNIDKNGQIPDSQNGSSSNKQIQQLQELNMAFKQINVLNLIKCHQQIIERIDNIILQVE